MHKLGATIAVKLSFADYLLTRCWQVLVLCAIALHVCGLSNREAHCHNKGYSIPLKWHSKNAATDQTVNQEVQQI